MANMLFANNANTTLASSLTNVATTMSVTSASAFPSPTGSQYFYCTLADAATQTTIEIVKVTAVSGTTFTIVRGQDGTSGTAFSSGAVVSLRLVRASLNDFPKLDEANTFTFAPTFNTALATGSGGTGLTAFTSGGVPYATSTSALTTNGSLQFSGQVLGVGNTANSWTAAYRVLQLGLGASILGRTDDPGLEIGENEYRDVTTGNRIYLATQPAAMYHMYSGAHQWFTAVSGTAGNTISFTQQMTLFNSGGVSIGNTTDPGAGNLRFNTTNSNGIYFGSSSILTDYEYGNYTPTVTAGTGTITSYTSYGSYTKVGQMVTVEVQVNITNAGTGTGALNISLPYATKNVTGYFASNGREIAISGSTLGAQIAPNTSTATVLTYANSTICVTNASVVMSFTYPTN